MIGCTKLLCGTATVSDVIKHSSIEGKCPGAAAVFQPESAVSSMEHDQPL